MTQLLAKVSDLARLDFDLLDHLNQERVLNDLQHLMLTDFPVEELPEKTRVAFAAAKLCLFSPRLQPLDSQLSRALLEKIALKNEIAAARSTLRSLSPGKRAYQIESQTLKRLQQERTRSALLIAKLFNSIAVQSKTRARQTIEVLWEAIRSHPEKLSLWQKLLGYMETMGENPAPLFRRASTIKKTNELAVTPICAKLQQILSRHLFGEARKFLFWGSSAKARDLAAENLYALYDTKQFFFANCDKYYERAAAINLSKSFYIVGDLLSDSHFLPSDRGIPRKQKNRIASAAESTKLDLDAADLWWVGLELANIRSTIRLPASLHNAVRRLPAKDPASWRIWELFGLTMPETALKEISKSLKPTFAHDVGSLADFFFGFTPQTIRKYRNSRNPQVRQIARLMLRRETLRVYRSRVDKMDSRSSPQSIRSES